MKYQVCVDASLALKWFIPVQRDIVADMLLEKWTRDGEELIGPPLFDAEVTSTLRLNVFAKGIPPGEGEVAFQFFRDLNVHIVNPAGLQPVAWELAKKYDLPRAYDMQYLAVAELSDCELWTADKRLVNALQGQNKRVHWVGEI
jgi:predicted nucleic acid-binding protein